MKLNRFFIAMTIVIIASNYLVLFPINDWLTWSAATYPFAFLISELTNKLHGPKKARSVVYLGFFLAVFVSAWVANFKIALASGLSFLISQLLDIFLFSKVRQTIWWYAPLAASLGASIVDSAIFWNIAFWNENVPLLTWALGDTFVKFAMDLLLLIPFRITVQKVLNEPIPASQN